MDSNTAILRSPDARYAIEYVCDSRRAYERAEGVFHFKFQQRQAESCSLNALASLSRLNWVVSLMKLERFHDAEEVCRKGLAASLQTLEVVSSSDFALKCCLAASLLLSGQATSANVILTDINNNEQDLLITSPAKEYYEYLRSTMSGGVDHFLLRDSGDGLDHFALIVPNEYEHINGSAARLTTGPQASNAVFRHRSVTSAQPTQPGTLSRKQWNKFVSLPKFIAGKRTSAFAKKNVSAANEILQRNRETSSAVITDQKSDEGDQRATIASDLQLISTHSHWLGLPEPLRTITKSTNSSDVQRQGVNVVFRHRGRLRAEPERIMEWLDTVESASTSEQSRSEVEAAGAQGDDNYSQVIGDKVNTSDGGLSAVCPVKNNEALRLTDRSVRTDRTSKMKLADCESQLRVKIYLETTFREYIERNALLDTGSAHNLVSEDFCNLIGAKMDASDKKELATVSYRTYCEVVGHVTLTFSWEAPITNTKRTGFYVIKDSRVDMLFGNPTIQTYDLMSSGSSFIAFIRGSRPVDVSIAVNEITPATAEETCNALRVQDHTDPKPLPDCGSLLGGSETTTPSRTLSMSGSSLGSPATVTSTSESLGGA